jgi:uncharacterized membrane protein YbhN (UPF0104 family)
MVRHSISENLEMPGTLTSIRIKPKGRLRRAVGIALPLIFLLLAAWMLHRELSDYHVRDVVDELSVLSWQQVALACACAILAYLALAGYDWLALLHVRHPLPLTKVASTAFISYALSYNLGYGFVMGGSVRYRLYSSWGLTSADAAKVVAFCVLTFWVGLAAIAGIICLHEAATIANALHLPSIWIRPLGALLVLIVIGYLVWSAVQPPPLRIRGWELGPPLLWIAVGQIVVTALDLVLAGTVLFILLPENMGLSYPGIIGVYMIAVILGLASQVPGGLGVFETAFLHLLPSNISPPAVTGALIAYRTVYYIFPLLIALLLLGGHELQIRLKQRGGQS